MATTLADAIHPLIGGATAPGGGEPQSPPSDLTPNSPTASSPGSHDEDGTSRKRSASGSIKEGKERTANKICRVCGDKAYSYNFNVITCESCKAFFRRNANKEKEIRCPFNEACEINVVSRRFCQRCRLFKCFQVGMKKEWIMTDEARLEKKARVEENRERRREEAKRKDGSVEGPSSAGSSNGGGHHHYRTTSVSSGSGKSAAATAAAAAQAAAETASIMQQHHQQQQQQQAQQQAQVAQQVQQVQQQIQQQAALFQPELPTLSTTTANNLLDAIAQQVAVQQAQPTVVVQPAFPAAALPTAAALVAAVAAPQAPTNSELVAIALEQQLAAPVFGAPPVAPQPTSAATAAAVYQAAAAHHHHQQQQMAAAVAAAQQIVSMTTAPPPPLDMAAAFGALQQQAQPPPATPTTAAAAILGASPLGPLTQAALIMDASAAATQQLQQQLAAAAAPPPSALAAVASTMLLDQQQQQLLLQPTATPQLPSSCCCKCNCGKYAATGRTIVEQAKEEWEAERRSNSAAAENDELGLSELLPSASNVSWLNTDINRNPLTDALSALPSAMSVDEAYGDLTGLFRSPMSLAVDLEFGPMQPSDEDCLEFINKANKQVWTEAALDEDEKSLHKQELPTKAVMIQMMVGAVKRMISMAKKFPALKSLHSTDQLKLIKSCYLDVMIIRGAMAYDPKQNAWKGPTSNHDYKIKMDAMNDDKSTENMFHQSIRLYTMFKEEYRQNENVMLLLNMIVLFDPHVPDLANEPAVREEQNRYKRCLKRYMYTTYNASNAGRVHLEYASLLDRLATVRKMNSGARGIMEENADSMDPLLKELLGAEESACSSVRRHSPRSVSSTASIDFDPPQS